MALVDFADEEGARFGRSLFGSSAVAGTLDPAALEDLTDADGRPIREVLAEHGVDLDAAAARVAHARGPGRLSRAAHRAGTRAGERGHPGLAAVTGTVGVERHRMRFEGQAAHAGTTPMEKRRDAGLAAAATALTVEDVARRHEGVGTTGALQLDPGVVTAVPGLAELSVDLRHARPEALSAMLEIVGPQRRRRR